MAAKHRIVHASILMLIMLAFIGTAAAAVVSVVPSSQNVTPGSTFSVDVKVDPSGNMVKGVEINLKFDPGVVQLDSVVIGNFLGSNSQQFVNDVDNTLGTLHLAHTVKPGNPAVSAPGTYATLNFKVKSNAPAGTSALDLTGAKLANDTGANIPGVAANDGDVFIAAAGTAGANATPSRTSSATSINATQKPASTPIPANTTPVNVQGTTAATTTASPAPTEKVPGFELALAVAVLSTVYLLMRKEWEE